MYLGDSEFWCKIICPSLFLPHASLRKTGGGSVSVLFPKAKAHSAAILEKPVFLCFYKLRRRSALICDFKNTPKKARGQEGRREGRGGEGSGQGALPAPRGTMARGKQRCGRRQHTHTADLFLASTRGRKRVEALTRACCSGTWES